MNTFQDVSEVLHAFTDAIKAHRSLFQDHGVLHQDVSFNNILLTTPRENRGCSGMLIDFDHSAFVGENGENEPIEGMLRVGTREFMAIQIMENEYVVDGCDKWYEHTYRHDLESFYYVFLSLCIRHGWPLGKAPKPDPLVGWSEGHPLDIGAVKRRHATFGGLYYLVLPLFSPKFQALEQLARNLRAALFGQDGMYMGTPENSDTLYDAVIDHFQQAIRDVKSGKFARRPGLS